MTVSLYGSNNYGQPGELLGSTQTDLDGWFGLIAPAGYDYYSIVETTPSEYRSEAAFSPEGECETTTGSNTQPRSRIRT